MGVGAGMSCTGGGAAVGVPVAAGSLMILANGCATTGHGAAELGHLLRDGDVPSESPAPAPGQWVLKKPAEKPATQAPVAKAAPAVKPATPPAVAQQTTTTTLFKSTGKRVTKRGETTTTTTPRVKGKPSATSADVAPVAKPRGGENPAAARGRQVHEEFKQKVAAKKDEGWKENVTLYDANGRKLHPDALTPNKNPIELKPNTPSGRAAGKRQIKKYEAATGKRGRVIYYDP